jgi:hypothetical protein
MAQVGEHLFSKHEALISKLIKERERKRKRPSNLSLKREPPNV